MSGDIDNHPEHCIAIVGMAARFPGAKNVDEYWHNLRAGKECIRRLSDHELRHLNVNIADPSYVKARGIIEGVEYFDAGFFGIPPRQAEILDPQQRVWLECVYEALEDSGFCCNTREDVVGVFAGARESTYVLNNLCIDRISQQELLEISDQDAHQIFLSNDRDSIATRTSYLFDFKGPSVNVQSACSTSLVAVAQACWSLANYQSDTCVAGGVCVTLPQYRGYHYQEGAIFSPDGHCRVFDALAQGTVFGDGVGVVVLKRLGDAIRDGDRVDAIIRGWAVNNDGKEKASFTAPSVNGQAEVITTAQLMADVEPGQIGYVEAHGTGTQVGDPIEVAGLTKAFSRQSTPLQYCGLGSVKSNIGHLDTAAGIAGLIKTVLALKNKELPASLHYKNCNQNIDFLNSPFYVVDKLLRWSDEEGPRIAGVSSFGVGGTNCHLVLEEGPEIKPFLGIDSRPVVVTFSAKNEQALIDTKEKFKQFLLNKDPTQIVNIAFTSCVRRRHHNWRFAIATKTWSDLIDQMDTGKLTESKFLNVDGDLVENNSVGFLFTGQGAQYPKMGKELFDTEPIFREAMQQCDQLLTPYLGTSILEILYEEDASAVHSNFEDCAQPAIFSLEYALTQLWRSWGVEPSWVLGHSLGEYVAACVSGIFSLGDSLQIVYERGRLMNALSNRGKMLAVFTDYEGVISEIGPYAPNVSVAALNAPQHIVISGPEDHVDAIASNLSEQGIMYRELNTSLAFHSPFIEPIISDFKEVVGKISTHHPHVDLVSTLTGDLVDHTITTADYWLEHSRRTVRFTEAISRMFDLGCRVFIEIGPDSVLTRLGQDTLRGKKVRLCPSMLKNESNWMRLSDTAAQHFTAGVDIDWRAFYGNRNCSPMRLPNYPFQRRRYWIDGKKSEPKQSIQERNITDRYYNPMLGHQLQLPGSSEIRFQSLYSRLSPHYLKDHRLFGRLVVPGASHGAMLAQAAKMVDPESVWVFREIIFMRPMYLGEDGGRILQLVFSPDSVDATNTMRLVSVSDEIANAGKENWLQHVVGRCQALPQPIGHKQRSAIDIKEILDRSKQIITGKDFYDSVWGNSEGTGMVFRWIDKVWKGDGEALARTRMPAEAEDKYYCHIHPGLIEAAFQVLHCCEAFETSETIKSGGVIFVPFSIDELYCFPAKADTAQIWCYATLGKVEADSVKADLYLIDTGGRLVAKIVGLCLRKLSRSNVSEHAEGGSTELESNSRRNIPERLTEKFGSVSESLSEILKKARDDERRKLLHDYFKRQWKSISGYSGSKFDSDLCLIETGFDSLMAVQIANRIKTDLGVVLTLEKLLSDEPIAGHIEGLVGVIKNKNVLVDQ
ncbi:MAG: beta-ketoacyl synthase N-terminal-like domain-containing protein [Gammaproteobacteria bacterium]